MCLTFYSCAQSQSMLEDDVVYLKTLNWFTTPAEYRNKQVTYQNNQELYKCIFNSDSLMTDCFVFFSNGVTAVHAKIIETKKVYMDNDTNQYYLNYKDQILTYYSNGNVRSIKVNTGFLESFSAYKKNGEISFQELTINQIPINGLIMKETSGIQLVLHYFEVGTLKAVIKTDYNYNILTIEFMTQNKHLIKKRIKKIIEFKYLGI